MTRNVFGIKPLCAMLLLVTGIFIHIREADSRPSPDDAEDRKQRPAPRESANLPEEKRLKIRQIRQESRRTAEDLREEVREAKQSFDEALASTRDESTLKSRFKAFVAAKEKLDWNRFQTLMRVHAELSFEETRELLRHHPPPPGPQ